mmetsp:Transcript_106636/g.244140  ORF Transcript_106636/g.244140 Transcript_106636/m.244140 type:complete len:255 (+) Transcript_106636:478-1242(+)
MWALRFFGTTARSLLLTTWGFAGPGIFTRSPVSLGTRAQQSSTTCTLGCVVLASGIWQRCWWTRYTSRGTRWTGTRVRRRHRWRGPACTCRSSSPTSGTTERHCSTWCSESSNLRRRLCTSHLRILCLRDFCGERFAGRRTEVSAPGSSCLAPAIFFPYLWTCSPRPTAWAACSAAIVATRRFISTPLSTCTRSIWWWTGSSAPWAPSISTGTLPGETWRSRSLYLTGGLPPPSQTSSRRRSRSPGSPLSTISC